MTAEKSGDFGAAARVSKEALRRTGPGRLLFTAEGGFGAVHGALLGRGELALGDLFTPATRQRPRPS